MRRLDGRVLYSATDLVRFAECRHHIALDLQNLEAPLQRTEDSAEAVLFAEKGDQHEADHLERLRTQRGRIVNIDKTAGLDRAIADTEKAMREGADVVFQATFRLGQFAGHADFVVRCPGKSDLGDFSYEVVDTKLARSERAKFLIQIGLYSDMLVPLLGRLPERMHVQLGTNEQVSYRVSDYIHYLRTLQADFFSFVDAGAQEIYPDPCSFCAMCQWRGLCEERRERDDHLSGIAGILGSQIQKLTLAGISTIAQLALIPDTQQIPKLASESLTKVRRQAQEQVRGRKAGKPTYQILPPVAGGKGFARLPPPCDGDVFFDFEGDPLVEGGLEYLFGVGYLDKGALAFMPIWAHTRVDEGAAFDQFMRWLMTRLGSHPALHIYHYGQYEVTALKRLMSLHGLHEPAIDQLLREHRFVDLYRVVRESLTISEPGYSLKNVEKFFMPKREGDVSNAAGSIVYYERWRETNDDSLLQMIEAYNRFDVDSTWNLANWLRRIQPPGSPVMPSPSSGIPTPSTAPSAKVLAHEQRLGRIHAQLRARIDSADTDEDRRYFQLVADLADFHRRAEKPGWWAFFERSEADTEQLLDDMDCIACCEQIPTPEAAKIFPAGFGAAYRFPKQEYKLRIGDSVIDVSNLKRLGSIEAISEEHDAVLVKTAKKLPSVPEQVHLGAEGPLSSEALRSALFGFAEAVGGGEHPYRAVDDLLRRRGPRLKSAQSGKPLLSPGDDVLDATLRVLLDLDDSVLFIQGPPGCGKTYSASHLIVELIRRGKIIGVASNSHKAINNLLEGIEEAALKAEVTFVGCKKSSSGREDTEFSGRLIGCNAALKPDAAGDGLSLVAGTVFFLAAPSSSPAVGEAPVACSQPLDYLFIDEAGQVALANTVIMGMRAHNIVLVGDQMQLGQPIQGVHPGRSGESTLDYLLDGHSTVAPEAGVLLEETWRMHPAVCRFISEAVYDGRLRSHPSLQHQALLLNERADPRLKKAGLVYIPVSHQGCAQRSDDEADVIRGLYENLLAQRYRDRHEVEHDMSTDNVIVVAPYNAQVNRLQQVLPKGARVGTVDKFQGQEAEVVIISMATSSAATLPRNIEFLFSRNRLNVAISRARCLSVLVSSPELLRIPCQTPHQMALVNTLDWVVNAATSIG